MHCDYFHVTHQQLTIRIANKVRVWPYSSQFQYFNCAQIICKYHNNLENLLTQLILPQKENVRIERFRKKQTDKQEQWQEADLLFQLTLVPQKVKGENNVKK